MVTTVTPYTDYRNRAYPGLGYDGVVRVSTGDYYGSGVLLYDGRAILTAAHLVQGVTSATVQFDTLAGTETMTATRIEVIPSYDSLNSNNDLALLWLPHSAPVAAERYSLYRDGNEVGQTTTLVGYGAPGTGDAGQLYSYSGHPLRQFATNRFDGDTATLKSWVGSVMGWTPTPGTQLVADFDNGTYTRDALGRLMNQLDYGTGQSEGMIAPGDSGGPAFINGQVAGIASYTSNLYYGAVHPDIDALHNHSYGEEGYWQRVSHYQDWIDQRLRAQYADAPTTPDQVKTWVTEGSGGTTLAYFMLRFTGTRSDPNQVLSVDYTTRDGTATADSDYLPLSGKLVLYPGETQALIPVELIGDTTPEAAETFYLDVTNPVGGSFGDGVVKLTALRTIVDDDGWLG